MEKRGHFYMIQRKRKCLSGSYGLVMPQVLLGVVAVVLFFGYVLMVGSIMQNGYTLVEAQEQRKELVARNRALLQQLSKVRSLEYIAQASSLMSLEEIRHATYLKMDVTGLVAKR